MINETLKNRMARECRSKGKNYKFGGRSIVRRRFSHERLKFAVKSDELSGQSTGFSHRYLPRDAEWADAGKQQARDIHDSAGELPVSAAQALSARKCACHTRYRHLRNNTGSHCATYLEYIPHKYENHARPASGLSGFRSIIYYADEDHKN